jgi:hypothetical protein
MIENNQLVYRVYMPSGAERDILPANKVIHIKTLGWNGLKGISPVSMASESMGVAMAAQRLAAKSYANGGFISGVIQHPSELSEDAYKRLKNDIAGYSGAINGGKTPILEGGATWVMTNMTAKDIELIKGREFGVREICRCFGVPPNMLFEASQTSYASNSENNEAFFHSTLRPWLEVLEAEEDFKLLSVDEPEYCIEHRYESLLRANVQQRADYMYKLFAMGALTPNDVRAMEGMNPVDDGDETYVNFQPVSKLLAEPEPVPPQLMPDMGQEQDQGDEDQPDEEANPLDEEGTEDAPEDAKEAPKDAPEGESEDDQEDEDDPKGKATRALIGSSVGILVRRGIKQVPKDGPEPFADFARTALVPVDQFVRAYYQPQTDMETVIQQINTLIQAGNDEETIKSAVLEALCRS